jgi:hypothetical protein
MPVSGDFPVQAPPAKEWNPVPEDVYQVVIKDIDEKDMQKFQSTEMETFYLFKFVILEGEEGVKNETLTAFVARKWFAGSTKGKKTLNPSKLVNLVKAAYGFYYPKLDVSFLTADDMTAPVVNDLIGKQLRIAVKMNDDKTNNKVTDFMAIKKELEISSEIKVAQPKSVAQPKVGAMDSTPAKSVTNEQPEEVKSEEPKTDDIPF